MRWFMAACALCALAIPAGAATYVVRPDGTGDFATIQAAIDAAAGGDVIALADGTFTGPGNRDIDYHGKAITVRSQSGDPSTCVINCGGSDGNSHRGFRFNTNEGPGSVLEAVTVTRGFMDGDVTWPNDCGGAVWCLFAAPTITRCVFSENHAGSEGGAVWTNGGSPGISDCRFFMNEARDGGGLSCTGGAPTVEDCTFTGNRGDSFGAGIFCYGSDARVTRCILVGNVVRHGAVACQGGAPRFNACILSDNQSRWGNSGAVYCVNSSPTWESCTFLNNQGAVAGGMLAVSSSITIDGCTFYGNSHEAIELPGSSTLDMTNSIVALTPGHVVGCHQGSNAVLACCDLYHNGENWTGCIADQLGVNGNISVDPLFCDAPGGDLTLESASPCAPENNPECGQIGAWPVGCGSTPAQSVTWGALKMLFRK
jgi:hypothetical protein